MATDSAVRGASLKRPAGNFEAVVALRAMRLEHAGDDVGEVGALPIAPRQHIVRPGQREQPAGECLAGTFRVSLPRSVCAAIACTVASVFLTRWLSSLMSSR